MYKFDGVYSHVLQNPNEAVDVRHIYWMCDVLSRGRFKRTLEIGCGNGATATAFVEAIKRGASFESHFCDVNPRDGLHSVLMSAPRNWSRVVHQKRSVDLLREDFDFDFVFIDGDHSVEAVQEEVGLIFAAKVRCMMLHDTSADQSPGHFGPCPGPAYAKCILQGTPPYRCLEDSRNRRDEFTHRGMLLATRDEETFEIARNAYAKWMY